MGVGENREKPTVEGTRKLEKLVPEGFTQFPPIRRRSEVRRLHPSGRACPLVSNSLDKNAENRGKGVGLPANPLAERPEEKPKVSSRPRRGAR